MYLCVRNVNKTPLLPFKLVSCCRCYSVSLYDFCYVCIRIVPVCWCCARFNLCRVMFVCFVHYLYLFAVLSAFVLLSVSVCFALSLFKLVHRTIFVALFRVEHFYLVGRDQAMIVV